MDGMIVLRLLLVLPAIFVGSSLAAYALLWLLAAVWIYLLAGAAVVAGLFVLAAHVA